MTRASREEGNVGRVLVPALERAQAEGAVLADTDVAFVARTLAFTLASRALAQPDITPGEALTLARSLLTGVAKAPAPRRANAGVRRAAG
jgi:hypothetical protein